MNLHPCHYITFKSLQEPDGWLLIGMLELQSRDTNVDLPAPTPYRL